ncbi:MAG: hypothetical protein ACE5IQ_08990 [Candidatus Methylomirabilales bacterium]
MSVDHISRTVGSVLITLLLLASGCASAPKPETARPLEGPADIPIPAGFQKIDKESVLIAFSGFQAGLVVYEGEREPSWVVDFYRGVLPSQGWSLVASFISQETILLFTKERQACVISVSGSRSSTRLEVRVGIVEPVAGGSSPSPGPSQPAPGTPR